MKLSELAASDPISALVYGPSGTGKTTLLGLMAMHPELSPVYIADTDLRAVSMRVQVPQEAWQNIEVVPYRDSRVQGEACTMLEYNLGRLADFKTIVIDSFTFLMNIVIMSKVLYLDGGKPATQTPQLQNYMQQQSIAKKILSDTRSKGTNFIITCHEGTLKDDVSGRLFKGLDLSEKFANVVPGYFNELWHTEVQQLTGKEPAFMIRTRSDMVFSARTTFRTLDTLERQELIWPKIIREQTGLALPTPPST